ncbi:MAG: hypothetical protein AAGH15_28490 [Myxococcota bacterium]
MNRPTFLSRLGLAAALVVLASCGEDGGAQILDGVWQTTCPAGLSGCFPGAQVNQLAIAGDGVAGFCQVRREGTESVLDFLIVTEDADGDAVRFEVDRARYDSETFTVVPGDCRISFTDKGTAYGTGSSDATRGSCGPAAPSATQPCQLVIEEVPAGEIGNNVAIPYTGTEAGFGDEIRFNVLCESVGNPNNPTTTRRNLSFSEGGGAGRAASFRGINCTEM